MTKPDSLPFVPGYRTLHAIGRGGMASVFLAVQQSVEREVALKIMSPHLLADPTFGERFLREARIAAKLHHRHVVSIYDVGVYEGVHYCAMEYLPGGPVMRRNGPPLALKPAIRCIREIASALHYAQEKGFIHRDVKPDNILLREDGSCVLGDFGIARAADSGTIMTKTGSVVGTPHYMSPEQLRGRAIDGRADLYSLGVVFFQLLTGKVPYEASDSLAVGIMHMTAPLPQLPSEYRFLQPVLEKLLAKEPIDRFQTGNEFDHALTEAESRHAKGLPPLENIARRREPEPGSPTKALKPLRSEGYDTQGAARTEPQIGSFDDFDREPMRAIPGDDIGARKLPSPLPPPARSPVMGVLLVIVVLIAVGWWQRERITQWLPRTTAGEAETDVSRGEKALASGVLHGQPGVDALSSFTAALMLNPDDARARDGLTRTLDRLHAQLAGAEPRDTARIEVILKRLQGVRGFTEQQARFQSLLSAAPVPPEPIEPTPPVVAEDSKLRDARSAESQGQLDGSSGALALFAAALRAHPNDVQARNGVNRVAAAMAGRARSLLEGGDLAAAQSLQRELESVPAAAALAIELQQRIAALRAPEPDAPTAADRIAEARQLSERGRHIDPRGNSAADRYRLALGLDPGNAQASAGLAKALDAGLAQAQQALERKDLARAKTLMARLQQLAPRLAGLQDLKDRISNADAAALGPDPAERARHDNLVREGEVAMSLGQILDPPGDSAYDKFRAAQAIDPRSVTAKAGLNALAAALRERIAESLASGRLERANGDVRALRTVAYKDPNLMTLRARVIRAYVERGMASLARNDVAAARTDLGYAEGLDGADPAINTLRTALTGR